MITISTRLISFQTFLSPKNWKWMLTSLSKLLNCRRFSKKWIRTRCKSLSKVWSTYLSWKGELSFQISLILGLNQINLSFFKLPNRRINHKSSKTTPCNLIWSQKSSQTRALSGQQTNQQHPRPFWYRSSHWIKSSMSCTSRNWGTRA